MTERDAIARLHDLARQVREIPPEQRTGPTGALAINLAETAEQVRNPEHNGWANYETWAVNLWLSNDAGLYEETREHVAAVRSTARDDDTVARGTWTVEQAERFRLADRLKEWVRDELAPDLGATFAADLLGSALDNVEWDEIAAGWLADD